jgi:predicted nuclease of predicted toxin-antitoxin system
MKLLFDQNLSFRLPLRLADLFPQSVHVRLIGMEQATDSVIWEYAKNRDFVIVSYDSDFAERNKLFGPPPKIVWLRCGNSPPREIEALLRANASAILDL